MMLSSGSMADVSITILYELNRVYGLDIEEEIHRSFLCGQKDYGYIEIKHNGLMSILFVGNKQYGFDLKSRLYECYFMKIEGNTFKHGRQVYRKSQDQLFFYSDRLLR